MEEFVFKALDRIEISYSKELDSMLKEVIKA